MIDEITGVSIKGEEFIKERQRLLALGSENLIGTPKEIIEAYVDNLLAALGSFLQVASLSGMNASYGISIPHLDNPAVTALARKVKKYMDILEGRIKVEFKTIALTVDNEHALNLTTAVLHLAEANQAYDSADMRFMEQGQFITIRSVANKLMKGESITPDESSLLCQKFTSNHIHPTYLTSTGLLFEGSNRASNFEGHVALFEKAFSQNNGKTTYGTSGFLVNLPEIWQLGRFRVSGIMSLHGDEFLTIDSFEWIDLDNQKIALVKRANGYYALPAFQGKLIYPEDQEITSLPAITCILPNDPGTTEERTKLEERARQYFTVQQILY